MCGFALLQNEKDKLEASLKATGVSSADRSNINSISEVGLFWTSVNLLDSHSTFWYKLSSIVYCLIYFLYCLSTLLF